MKTPIKVDLHRDRFLFVHKSDTSFVYSYTPVPLTSRGLILWEDGSGNLNGDEVEVLHMFESINNRYHIVTRKISGGL